MTYNDASIAGEYRRAKIILVGAGNPSCADLLQNMVVHAEALKGSHIVLADTDEEALQLMYTLGSKLFDVAGAELTLEQNSIIEEAIDDADFVLTSFQTGGVEALQQDERIALRFGIRSEDSIGPSGFFAALRSAPIVSTLAVEMEKVAPKAFLLNYTHPTNIITEAIAHASGIRVIGLNQDPMDEIQQIISTMEPDVLAKQRLATRTVGLHQGNWTTAVWRSGVNILPAIVAWCEEYIHHRPEMTIENYAQVMLYTLTAHYGAIPSRALLYYYFPEIMLQFSQQKTTSYADDLQQALLTQQQRNHEEAKKEMPTLAPVTNSKPLGRFALDILLAILHNTGDERVLNVKNEGALRFLPHDRVVEVPCRVDARGATPFVQGDGGIQLDQRGLLAQLAEYEGATARAALWGTRKDAIRALTANPLVMSYSKAEALYDALATANAHYLPERLLT